MDSPEKYGGVQTVQELFTKVKDDKQILKTFYIPENTHYREKQIIEARKEFSIIHNKRLGECIHVHGSTTLYIISEPDQTK